MPISPKRRAENPGKGKPPYPKGDRPPEANVGKGKGICKGPPPPPTPAEKQQILTGLCWEYSAINLPFLPALDDILRDARLSRADMTPAALAHAERECRERLRGMLTDHNTRWTNRPAPFFCTVEGDPTLDPDLNADHPILGRARLERERQEREWTEKHPAPVETVEVERPEVGVVTLGATRTATTAVLPPPAASRARTVTADGITGSLAAYRAWRSGKRMPQQLIDASGGRIGISTAKMYLHFWPKGQKLPKGADA